MSLIDFSKFDLLQLKQLHRELADEIDQRIQAERERVADEIRRLANSVGMTVEEVMASRKGKKARKSKEQSAQPIGDQVLKKNKMAKEDQN